MNSVHREARQMCSPEAARYKKKQEMVKGLYEDTLKMEVILVLEVLFDLHSVCMLSYSRQPWCSRSSRE